jgi:hypothetical protein
MNRIKAIGSKVAVGATSLALSGLALAQTAPADPGVEAITNLTTKATSYTTAAFGVAVLVAGAFWGIRMMKKSFGAAK